MKLNVWLSILVVIAFTLNGCADKRLIRDNENDLATASLVFGYIDMSDAPSDLDWIVIKQVLPKTDKPFWFSATDKGMFWASHYKKGAYQIDSFGGHSYLLRTDFSFELPKQYAEKLRFKVSSKPGIYFLGSYKYKDVKTGFFQQGKFDFVPVKSPTERELLERLLKFTKSKTWEARIKSHVAALPK